jgi:hypothetical protein
VVVDPPDDTKPTVDAGAVHMKVNPADAVRKIAELATGLAALES